MPDGVTDYSSQRPAIDIETPALTRHVTFRLSKAENPRFVRKPKWTPLLDKLSAHLRDVDACGGAPAGHAVTLVAPNRASREDKRRYSIDRTALIPVIDDPSRGFRFRVRVDVSTEILSVTYIVDRITDAQVGGAWTDIAALDDNASPGAERRIEALDRLYLDFWKSTDGPIGAARINAWCVDDDARGFGRRLVDLRGVVIRSHRALPPGERSISEEIAPGLQGFVAAHRDGLIARATGRCGGDRPRGPMAGEPVFCGMLGGCALYIAELGRRSERAVIEPIRHLLVFDDSPAAQIGRLVRRLHILGELRHAALMDYSRKGGVDLRSVSRDLRDLGTELDRDLAASVNKPAVNGLPKIIRRVGKLTANADEGGLTYRIEQSRYYARQFKKTVEHLRTVRLRHYQSYDDFVARYVYQLFDRIDRIGSRYDLFLRRLSLLTTLRLSQEIESYQRTVAGALKTLNGGVIELRDATNSVREASMVQIEAGREQNRAARTLVDLQQEARLVGVIILVYYAGSALNHAFETEGPVPHLVEHWMFMLGWNFMLLGLIACFGWLLARSLLNHRIEPEAVPEELAASVHRSETLTELAITPVAADGVDEPARTASEATGRK